MEVQELERLIRQQEVADASVFSALMRKVYVWMTLALVITGITAVGVANSPNLLTLIYGNSFAMWGLIIAELGLVMYVSARIEKLSLSTATILFATGEKYGCHQFSNWWPQQPTGLLHGSNIPLPYLLWIAAHTRTGCVHLSMDSPTG